MLPLIHQHIHVHYLSLREDMFLLLFFSSPHLTVVVVTMTLLPHLSHLPFSLPLSHSLCCSTTYLPWLLCIPPCFLYSLCMPATVPPITAMYYAFCSVPALTHCFLLPASVPATSSPSSSAIIPFSLNFCSPLLTTLICFSAFSFCYITSLVQILVYSVAHVLGVNMVERFGCVGETQMVSQSVIDRSDGRR